MKCYFLFLLLFFFVNSVKHMIPNDSVKFVPSNDQYQKTLNYFQLLNSINQFNPTANLLNNINGLNMNNINLLKDLTDSANGLNSMNGLNAMNINIDPSQIVF